MLDPCSAQNKSEKDLMDILMKIERALGATTNSTTMDCLMKEKEYIIQELSDRRFIESFKADARPSSQNLTDDELSRNEEAEEKSRREALSKKKKN